MRPPTDDERRAGWRFSEEEMLAMTQDSGPYEEAPPGARTWRDVWKSFGAYLERKRNEQLGLLTEER